MIINELFTSIMGSLRKSVVPLHLSVAVAARCVASIVIQNILGDPKIPIEK